MNASHCARCPVSLLCLAERLVTKVHLYCDQCGCLELDGEIIEEPNGSWSYPRVRCPRSRARDFGVTLSICVWCKARRSIGVLRVQQGRSS